MTIQACFKSSVAILVAACMIIVGAVVGGGSARCAAQENASAAKQAAPSTSDTSENQKSNAKSRDPSSVQSNNVHADDESPALGVVVSSCPGDGVCVTDTVWGSPAQRAGIARGDYILSLDDQNVSTPSQLRQMVQKHRPGEKVNVTIWRQGEETTKELTLATKSNEPPASDEAWLGVRLSRVEEGQTGIVIAAVHPASPADKVGLLTGDVITRINGDEVTSIEQFVDAVRDFGPGSELKLTIQRNGAEQLIAVVLGRVDEAPLRWLRRAFRPSGNRFGIEIPGRNEMTGTEMIDEVLDEMREQIRALQEEVGELRLQQSPNKERDKERDKERGAEQQKSDRGKKTAPQDKQPAPAVDTEARQFDNDGDTLSSRDVLLQDSVRFVVQRDGQDAARFGTRRYRWDDSDNWRAQRRWEYRYRYDRPYSPIYRSPRYGNSYYYYRGLPYYYGGAFRYGPRGSIRIGPNFGLYWY